MRSLLSNGLLHAVLWRYRVDEIDRTIAAGPFRTSWDSLTGYRVPAWYEDGKFGIFIH